jgi:SAM-dependent methyltransferase
VSTAPAGCLGAALYDWECEHVAGRRDQDVDFYAGLVSELGGQAWALELACGTGRVSVPLAERARGARVVGLDIDHAMLAAARSRALAAGSRTRHRVALVRADMRRFALARAFDLVAIPYNSLQLLHDDADVAACVECAAAHLGPGGVLALEVTDYGQGGGPDGLGTVRDEPLGAGVVAGSSVELFGGLDHDPVTRVTRYHRRWTVRGRGADASVMEDTVALRSLDEPTLDGLVLAAGLEPGEREQAGPSLRYTARRRGGPAQRQ